MALAVEIEKRLSGDFLLRVCFETDRSLLALLGASGSGKSVTLRCVAGLMKPDWGRILLNGRTLFDSEKHIDLPPRQRRVGYLFQSYALFPHKTVLENVELGLHALPRKERRAAALAQLERFRLLPLADSFPATLSGGERQRTALARTLAAEPEALLLDEPFSALDEYLRWQLELELAGVLERYGGDAVLVTHSRDEACRLAGRVCVLDRGRSEPPRAVEELMTRPGTVSAARISGCKNVSPVRVLPEGELLCLDWAWKLPAMSPPPGLSHVGIRAHSLRLGPGPISLGCRLDRVMDNVFSEILMLRTPGPGLLRLELPKAASRGFAPGQTLTVHIAPEDILLLTGGDAP